MPLQKEKVLILDDDPVMTRLVENIVKNVGHEPVIAHNSAVLNTEKVHKFSYIVLDLWLSDAFGDESLDMLISAKFRGGVILISGAVSEELNSLASYGSRGGLSVLGVLRKPFAGNELSRLFDARLLGEKASVN